MINNMTGGLPIKVKSLDKLIEIVEKEKDDIRSIKVKDGKTIHKKTSQIIEELGVSGRQMIDNRTESILKEYLYYKSNATPSAPYNSKLWKESVVILETTIQTGLF